MGKLDSVRNLISEVTGESTEDREARKWQPTFPPIPGFNPHEYHETDLQKDLRTEQAFLSFAALLSATADPERVMPGGWVRVDKTFLKAMFMGVVNVQLEYFDEDDGVSFRARAKIEERSRGSIADMMMQANPGQNATQVRVSHEAARKLLTFTDMERGKKGG